MAVILGRKGGTSGGGGGPPSGAAGGSLGGTYPNPTLSAAKQAEIDGKGLLASSVYAPGTRQIKTVTASSLTAFDTTNLTVSFTAPASGAVLVRFTGVIITAGGTDIPNLGLFSHGTSTVVGNIWGVRLGGPEASGYESVTSINWKITGLTPAASLQYDLMGATNNVTGVSVYCLGRSTVDVTAAGVGGPATFEVWGA